MFEECLRVPVGLRHGLDKEDALIVLMLILVRVYQLLLSILPVKAALIVGKNHKVLLMMMIAVNTLAATASAAATVQSRPCLTSSVFDMHKMTSRLITTNKFGQLIDASFRLLF